MPSRFESDLVGSSWDVLSSVHGEPIHYAPAVGGPATDPTGIVGPFTVRPDPSIEGQEIVSTTVLVKASDVPSPNEGDRVTVRTLVFAVDSFELRALGWALELEHVRQHVSGGDATHVEVTG